MSQKPLPPDLLRMLTGVSRSSQILTTSQISRLAKLIGQPLVEGTVSNPVLTNIGELALSLAQEMLDANDRVLAAAKAASEPNHVRLGINSMMLDFVVKLSDDPEIPPMVISHDTCSTIVKAFSAQTIDIAMVMDVKDHRSTLGTSIVAEFELDFAWACTNEFVLDREKPVPLAVWPADQFLFLDDLSKRGLAYRPMFSGPDYFAKRSALKSGKCLAVIPRKAIAAPLIEAKKFGLPSVSPRKVLLCANGDAKSARLMPIISALSSFNLASAW
jgi:DNA-binding transcriptional LysR family regulator